MNVARPYAVGALTKGRPTNEDDLMRILGVLSVSDIAFFSRLPKIGEAVLYSKAYKIVTRYQIRQLEGKQQHPSD